MFIGQLESKDLNRKLHMKINTQKSAHL